VCVCVCVCVCTIKRWKLHMSGKIAPEARSTQCNMMLRYIIMRDSKKLQGIIWHRRFGAQRIRTAWTWYYWSLLRASFAIIPLSSSEEAARQVTGTVISASRQCTKPHNACAKIPSLVEHSCHHPASILSGSRSEWLLASKEHTYFATVEDISSNATFELWKIKGKACISFNRGIDGVSVCAQGPIFEDD
jgi:hypothetical protein